MSERIAFFDQSYLPEDKACLPISDRGFLFGDGVFTTLKVCQGRVECYFLHKRRLRQQCEAIGIHCPPIDFQWIQELINRNKATQGVWRLKVIVTGGESPSLDLLPRNHGHLVMTLRSYPEKPEEPFRLTLYPYPLIRPLAQIKSLAYLDRLWVKKYALVHGFDEAIVVEENGLVLETAFSNLFWRIDQKIASPHPVLPLLQGIALQMVEKTAKEKGLSFEYVHARLDEIPEKAQLFICNSLKGIHPVVTIDKQTFARDLSWEISFSKNYQYCINRETEVGSQESGEGRGLQSF